MELLRALAVLAEPPAPEHARVARALGLRTPTAREHTDLFVLRLYPFASVYVGADGMMGGEARDRVAGFWRALGLVPPAEPDHLVELLALYAALDDADAPVESRRALLWEHLLSWLPPYLAKVREVGVASQRRWAALLDEALRVGAEELGTQRLLPLHLREAPPLEDDDLLDGVLTPVRSGMILLRDDLRRASGELGLGLRVGERRFALRSLLDQDAPAMLAWLAEEARAAAARHAGVGVDAGITKFWQGRAEAAAALLDHAVIAAATREVAHARG